MAVGLPARDEERTVGAVVTTFLELGDLIDELVVVDSGSTDRTAAVAAEAGARVVETVGPGKGSALWTGVRDTTADIVAFVDADLEDVASDFVTGLVGPLLCDPSVDFVKATYDRPLAQGEVVLPAGGGRVTEILARPLINLHWPELAGFVQPLGGEYAARRPLLESLPFPVGYGVELGILIDTWRALGLDAMAQVDLQRRKHRHQGDVKLGRMAAEILQVAERRLGRSVPGAVSLVQFSRNAEGEHVVDEVDVTEAELAPLAGS